MDWNTYLGLGYYDVKTSSLKILKNRLIVFRILEIIALFCAVKLFIIVLNVWSSDLKLYLIDVYFFDGDEQRLLDVGIAVQFGFFYSFIFWTNLSKNMNRLRSLNFLFIPNLKDLCDYCKENYGLNRRSTELLVEKSSSYRSLMFPTIASFQVFLTFFIFRCAYLSYFKVNLIYFLSLVIILTLVTIINHMIIIVFLITGFGITYLVIEFLVIRLKTINKILSKKFKKKVNFTRPTANSIKFKKQKNSKVLRILNDFVIQFEEINFILDSAISKMLAGIYLGFIGFPYFIIFSENLILIKLGIGIFAATFTLLCFSISFYNDSMKRQV